MCLVVFAVQVGRHYPLLLAANRDERHARPALPASRWADRPALFGGRDLAALGTWLAVDRSGRIAAVTNFREPAPAPAARSRGALVTDFLLGSAAAAEFGAALAPHAADYGPFSLLLFDAGGVRYVSNRAAPRDLGRGVHALSNAALGVDWPKIGTARAGMAALLDSPDPTDALLDLLAVRSDAMEPDDRHRAAHFIVGPVYGTRCSTVVLVDHAGTLTFVERSFDAAGRTTGEVRETFAIATA